MCIRDRHTVVSIRHFLTLHSVDKTLSDTFETSVSLRSEFAAASIAAGPCGPVLAVRVALLVAVAVVFSVGPLPAARKEQHAFDELILHQE